VGERGSRCADRRVVPPHVRLGPTAVTCLTSRYRAGSTQPSSASSPPKWTDQNAADNTGNLSLSCRWCAAAPSDVGMDRPAPPYRA
jgi:hypothetical protein